MWAKRAERKKREGEMQLIEQMQSEGLGVADLLRKKIKVRLQCWSLGIVLRCMFEFVNEILSPFFLATGFWN